MKKYGIEIKWALIFVAISLLWMLFEKEIGLHDQYIDVHAIYTNLFAIPAIALYVIALLDKRRNFYQGQMNYKQGFISGTIITLIVTVLSPLTQIITSNVITPEFFPNAIKSVVNSGKMTQEAAEQFFSLKNYIVQGLFGALVIGLITTAIVAIFTRKSIKT